MSKSVITFKPGDPIIITTSCEDIELHGLTGRVKSQLSQTGTYVIIMDVDDSTTLVRHEEIGHRY